MLNSMRQGVFNVSRAAGKARDESVEVDGDDKSPAGGEREELGDVGNVLGGNGVFLCRFVCPRGQVFAFVVNEADLDEFCLARLSQQFVCHDGELAVRLDENDLLGRWGDEVAGGEDGLCPLFPVSRHDELGKIEQF